MPGDSLDGTSIDVKIAHELFESFVGSVGSGTPQAAIYEPSAGGSDAFEDGGE
ncbi:hypothetical protein SAMN04487783_2829 [Agrococcus baldri]|uniref:Uncharacterized protein n=1 Tax=Agrococcus baldri TaxID=153730 RepID=A0AA94HQ49_9MICO|nr:hypothetical protein [Agrococcus baldri]SFS19118.1 hypothetical protein SAMN04487783_2829 [Agrococcus baldri]